MLHHLTLWVPDLGRAEESWAWLLGELGWARDPSVNRVLLFRHAGGSALVIEQSPDMVPGMLHSRFRPGLNHLAFSIPSEASLDAIASGAGAHGWQPLPNDPHRLIDAERVAYLEDRDGFEVELVEPHPRRPGPGLRRVSSLSMTILFPLTFASNVFVDRRRCRDGCRPSWSAALVAVFAPLTMRAFARER